MRWSSRAALRQGLVSHATKKLERLFDPAPDTKWKSAAIDFFSEMDDLDRDCRAALRVYDRSKAPARSVFEKLGMPIELTVEVFDRLPPSGRLLLLALIDGKKKIGPVLENAKRTRTEVEWIPPTLTSRGFVVHMFESCALVDTTPVPQMRWGRPRGPARYRLADLELAYIHAFLFPIETMNAVPMADPLDRSEPDYFEDERRRLKKAREHFGESKERGPRAGLAPGRLVLPKF